MLKKAAKNWAKKVELQSVPRNSTRKLERVMPNVRGFYSNRQNIENKQGSILSK